MALKSVTKSPPKVFAAAEISAIRSELKIIVEAIEEVFDLTGKAARRVDPEATCFLRILKNDLLKLRRRFDKSLKPGAKQ